MESFGTANGWVAVLILLGAAVFLPLLTVGITAFCLPRTTVENSEVHWAERARRLYPFKVVRIISLSVLPVLYAAANFYPDTMMPIPKWMFGSLVFLASFGSTNWIIWWLGRRYQLAPAPFWERLRNIPASTFIYASIFLFAVTAAILPDQWNWQCAVVLCAGLVAYFWLQFDGFLRVGRFSVSFDPLT
jgi:hypothetical protein